MRANQNEWGWGYFVIPPQLPKTNSPPPASALGLPGAFPRAWKRHPSSRHGMRSREGALSSLDIVESSPVGAYPDSMCTISAQGQVQGLHRGNWVHQQIPKGSKGPGSVKTCASQHDNP